MVVTTKSNINGGLIRLIDFALALIVLAFFLPALAFFVVSLRLAGSSPVFQREACGGRGGRVFSRLTFRTDGAGAGALKEHLQASGLDGLPQLWNVLCGEMSLVGPKAQLWRSSRKAARSVEMLTPGLYWPCQPNDQRSPLSLLTYIEALAGSVPALILMRHHQD